MASHEETIQAVLKGLIEDGVSSIKVSGDTRTLSVLAERPGDGQMKQAAPFIVVTFPDLASDEYWNYLERRQVFEVPILIVDAGRVRTQAKLDARKRIAEMRKNLKTVLRGHPNLGGLIALKVFTSQVTWLDGDVFDPMGNNLFVGSLTLSIPTIVAN